MIFSNIMFYFKSIYFSSRSSDVRSKFWELRDDFTDVTLICGDGDVRAHKVVLATSSEYFRRELKKRKNCRKLSLTNLSQAELGNIIEFIYKGAIQIESKKYERFSEIVKSLSLNVIESEKSTQLDTARKRKSTNDHLQLCGKRQKTDPIQFCNLPVEILTKILSYVSTYYLLTNVALVSKSLYAFTKTPGVHLTVSFSANSDEKSAVKFLEKARLIQELYVTKPKYFSWNDSTFHLHQQMELCDKVVSAVISHYHLKVLCIDDTFKWGLSQKCFASLKAAKWWKNLAKISLAVFPHDNVSEEFCSAVRELGSNGTLQHLNICCDKIMSLSVQTLTADKTNTKLKSLNMNEDHGLVNKHILKAQKDTLEDLTVEFLELSDYQVVIIASLYLQLYRVDRFTIMLHLNKIFIETVLVIKKVIFKIVFETDFRISSNVAI